MLKNSLLARIFVLVFLIGTAACLLPAQNINQAEFIDKPLKEILATLGAIGGRSLVVDETVNGNATHFLNNKTFEEALQIVLETNNLFKTESNGVLIISRIKIEAADNGRYNVTANRIDLETFLRRVARDTQKTILFDNFPGISLDVNLKGAQISDILKTVLTKLPGFTLETSDHYFYLHNMNVGSTPGGAGANLSRQITVSDGRYSIHAKNIKLSDVLETMFGLAKKEYSVIKKGDAIIDKLSFDDKDFDQLLRLVLDLTDADYTVQDGLYFIVDLNRTDILKKFEQTERLSLKYLSVNQLINLMPGSIANGSAFKIDRPSNSLILNGSTQEVKPIVDFVALVDRPLTGMQYYRFDLMNITPESLIPALPENLKSIEPIILKGQNSLILLLSPEAYEQAKRLLSMIDKPKSPFVIKLKYIKAEDFIAKLPSFISKDLVAIGIDQRYIFFTGSKDQYADLMNQMRFIDLPVPQIKYQVLVVQYQKDTNTDLGINLDRNSAGSSAIGDGKTFDLIGAIGNVAQNLLSFDIISDLGYLFTANLSASLKHNEAQVLLDTTLNALSNQDVTFKNTNTYRYPDTVTSQDTAGKTTTTTTKEIVSGIIITLKGWVSGDGMISMTINSTLTKQGTAGAGSTIPQTGEKVISTSVRTPSGKPIVVGGLMQHDAGNSGDILSLHADSQNTELMIYIIPRVETPIFYDSSLADSLMYLYNQYSPNGQHQEVL